MDSDCETIISENGDKNSSTTGTIPSQLAKHVQFDSGNSIVPGTSPRHRLFYCEIEDARTMVPLLRSILVNPMAVIMITGRGWKIIAEQPHRALQASTMLNRSYFKKYEMEDETTPISIYLKLNDLIHALVLMLQISIKQSSRPEPDYKPPLLRIKYEHEQLKMKRPKGMVTVTTYSPPPIRLYSMSFMNKVIMDASVLVNFWKMADNRSRALELKILDSSPWMEFVLKSDRARSAYRINAQSVHVEHYECTLPMSQRYELRLIHFSLRPLLLASKICLQMDANGLLLMQFMIRFDSGEQIPGGSNQKEFSITSNPEQTVRDPKNFVEFYFVPIVD